MNTPGNILRSEREKQNRSLEHVSQALKINAEYIKAIENDSYTSLPAEIFTKAYMRLYADALGIDGDYVLRLYDSQMTSCNAKKPEPPGKKITLASLKKLLLIRINYKPVIIIASLVLIGISIAVITKREDQQQPVTDILNEVSKSEVIEEQKNGELILNITAIELTWVSVSIDGGKPQEWLMRDGDTVTVSASEKFIVKIGNAGGTKVTFNNEDLGVLGPYGKVVDIVLP